MATGNSPYIAKAAGSLVNPTSGTLFLQAPSPIATVSSTQVLKVAYATYHGYNQTGTGVSNSIDMVEIVVRAAGRITYGVSGTFIPTLVIGAVGTGPNFLAATSTSTIGALSAATASAAGTGIWQIAANLYWDPNTGLISGTYSGSETTLVAGSAATTLTASAAITPLTGYLTAQAVSTQSNTTAVTIPAPTAELALFFAVSGIFNTSNANNLAIQDVLQTEAI